MAADPNQPLYATTDVRLADSLLSVAATLDGVSEALAYRASAEDDNMLAMLSDVLNDQIDTLRRLVR